MPQAFYIGYGPPVLDRETPAEDEWPANTLFLDELGPLSLDDEGVLVLE